MHASLSRLHGAVWGAFVGDAAALGSHWIYDPAELAARFPNGLQGFETPAPGHYHAGKVSGDCTHYGDAALLLLESLADTGGGFDATDFGRRFEAFFRAPDCRSYRDHATRETLARLDRQPGDYQNGADDDQLATVSRLAPLAAAVHQAPRAERLDAVRRLTRVTQNHPTALGCASAHALLLQNLFEGRPLETALENTRRAAEIGCDIADFLEAAHSLRRLDPVSATQRFGASCPLPQSFPAALQTALHHAGDLPAAILATLRAGGDSAGRAALIGAWLGAQHGLDAVPADWRRRLSAHDRIVRALERLPALQNPG